MNATLDFKEVDGYGNPMTDLKLGLKTNVVMDSDLKSVLEFMESNIAAVRLVAVADGVGALAKTMWGEYQPAETIRPLRLRLPPLIDQSSTSNGGQHIQSVAT